MSEHIDQTVEASNDPELTVGMRVRVYQGQSNETGGTVVEDFGDAVGVPIDIGDIHIADPARRWAVARDDGGLMFVDSEHLTIE